MLACACGGSDNDGTDCGAVADSGLYFGCESSDIDGAVPVQSYRAAVADNIPQESEGGNADRVQSESASASFGGCVTTEFEPGMLSVECDDELHQPSSQETTGSLSSRQPRSNSAGTVRDLGSKVMQPQPVVRPVLPIQELPEPQTIQFGTDVGSIEELIRRGNAYIIEGFHPELHKQAMAAWAPSTLQAVGLGSKSGGPSDTKNPDYRQWLHYELTKVAVPGGSWLRYRDNWKAPYRKVSSNSSHFEHKSGTRWPAATGDYDDYEERRMTIPAVLESPMPAQMSFKVEELPRSVYPAGIKALKALQAKICGLGCHSSVVWVGSKGARSAFHYDRSPNLFLQLEGSKEFVLSPPMATLRTASLAPLLGPLGRQSQLAFSTDRAGRDVIGYSIPAGNDTNRPAPTYDGSQELRVVLKPGMALYFPAFWGHRTYPEGPAVSLANWLHPPGIQGDPDKAIHPPRCYLEIRDAIVHALRAAPPGPVFAARYWRMFRALGPALAAALNYPRLVPDWYEQRWRPILGGFGITFDAVLPKVYCLPLADLSTIEQQVVNKQTRLIMEKLSPAVSFDVPRDRAVILEHFVGEFLDQIVGMHFLGVHEAGSLGDSEASTEVNNLMLGNAARSFVECN